MNPLLPPGFAATREALRALACYVVAPARKARTGRIGLVPTGDGFGTPAFDDGSRLVVRGDRLVWDPGDAVAITTLRVAAQFAGLELSGDPGVGHDLPAFEPDAPLAVDEAASHALGRWYGFGQKVLDHPPLGLGSAQLWPEHFDLAAPWREGDGHSATIGFSPGDTFNAEPYLYVSPANRADLADPFWNAPFGATLGRHHLAPAADPLARAIAFIEHALALPSA